MPLLPVATTRTSTPLSQQRLLHQLNADQLALQRQYDQLSSGRRVLRLSDDPAAAGRALGLQRGIDRTTQLGRNAGATEAFYQSTDSALARVDQALVEARGTSVSAAQSVLSGDEREAMATTVRRTLDSVFAAGNAMFRDHQLLGGVLEPGNAFQWDKGEVLFQGSDAVGQTKLGAGVPVATGVNGNQSLGAAGTFVEGEPLGAALTAETRLRDMRGGDGVTGGVIRLSDGNAWQNVDLRNAATIGDVADVLESIELGGRPLDVTINNASIEIDYADGLAGTLALDDTEGSTLARDLNISNPQGLTAPPLIGDELAPRVTASTRIADLNSGAGLDLSDGIQITQDDQTFVVELADAETVGEVLIAINRSGADVQAELSDAEDGIRLRALRSGVDYSVGENGGDAATELGIRSATEDTLVADLGRGRGLSLNSAGDDLVIARPDGVELNLNLESADTIEDVIQLIRDHPQNQDTARVLAGLNDFGNGLQLKAPPGADPLTVRQTAGSDAGVRLGLIPPGQTEAQGRPSGSVVAIQGADYLPREAGGAIDTLLRLEDAIRGGDIPEIERLQSRLDIDLDRASRTRGKVGVWHQNLDELKHAAEGKTVMLKSQLSNEVDADLATVISDMTQRQTALEASMRIIGKTAQLSVLNFL